MKLSRTNNYTTSSVWSYRYSIWQIHILIWCVLHNLFHCLYNLLQPATISLQKKKRKVRTAFTRISVPPYTRDLQSQRIFRKKNSLNYQQKCWNHCWKNLGWVSVIIYSFSTIAMIWNKDSKQKKKMLLISLYDFACPVHGNNNFQCIYWFDAVLPFLMWYNTIWYD